MYILATLVQSTCLAMTIMGSGLSLAVLTTPQATMVGDDVIGVGQRPQRAKNLEIVVLNLAPTEQ
jgi:hypothetical protein